MVGFPSVALILIVHLMLGFRRLRDIERYREDPVVLRALGLRRMPNVSTVCRTLCRADGASVRNVRLLSREHVLPRLETERLSRVTMDFDGSVISTGRFAEGTAVGYNNKRIPPGERDVSAFEGTFLLAHFHKVRLWVPRGSIRYPPGRKLLGCFSLHMAFGSLRAPGIWLGWDIEDNALFRTEPIWH
jgi:hypothetical protein